MNLNPLAAEEQFLNPLDRVNGFDIRPGLYEINGATSFGSCVNFTIHSQNAVSCELLLFHRGEKEPYGTIPFPENYRIGRVYSMIVFGLDIYDFEYAYRMDGPNVPEKGLIYDKTKVLLDPYARAVTQQSIWGKEPDREKGYHGRVVFNDFDWGDAREPKKPMQELIIYEMHVRGFTKHASSGVQFPGTFEGIREKIPYLKALGITAVELMPVFEFDETMGKREIGGRTLLDYWGYNTVGFFAPNTGYTARQEYNREGTEFKNLIRELHQNGIEVILDVVFNHTAEGNEQGPFFEFKGIDNRIYYMLTPEGNYYNFSGCGNTLNCNHPIVQQMILECLRHWVIHYRVDGFRFDLASILGRNEDGTPLLQPPLLRNLAEDPVLKDVNLIAEAWDAGGLYQVGNFPAWNRWAEWNGKYRDELRSFLKGEYWFAAQAAKRITGSPDAKALGYKAGDFSYNTGTLRCPGCDGTGVVSLDVQFLPDVNIPCPDCRGSRYSKAAYTVKLPNKRGAHISLPELMDMDVNTAIDFCRDIKSVSQKLEILKQLGLGYLTLGEETPGLSGGEAQRLKLASEIGKTQEDSVFVFDEPSIGLHPLDVQVLLGVFQALLHHGATVVVIEHDLDVIKNADYVIDMGPGGGEAGGQIIACGTPQEIKENPNSITGSYIS